MDKAEDSARQSFFICIQLCLSSICLTSYLSIYLATSIMARCLLCLPSSLFLWVFSMVSSEIQWFTASCPGGAPFRSLQQGDIVVPGGAPFSRLQRGEIVVPGGAPFRSLQQGDIVTPSPPSQCWSISTLRVEYVTEVLVIWSNFCLTFSIITLAVFNVVLSLDVKNKIGTYM